jgi:hypothetical protein
VLTVHMSSSGKQLGAAQFGSASDEGVDPFAENNLFAAPGAGGSVIVTGFTTGAPVNGTAPGNGDVFLATVDPAKGTP